MTQEILPQLQAYFQQAFPQKTNPKIENLIPLNFGWESVIYAFDAVTGSFPFAEIPPKINCADACCEYLLSWYDTTNASIFF